MVIRASSAGEVKPLVEALVAGDHVMRESAIARLAVIGSRATTRLLAAYAAAPAVDARVALLRALECVADRRAGPLAARALTEGGEIGVAAAGVLRALVTSPDTATATAALDALVSAAVDASADRPVRLAAIDSLGEVPGGVRERVTAALRQEGDAALQEGAEAVPRARAAADALWADALAGRLPDDPSLLREALQTRSAAAPLTALQRLIDTIRAREPSIHSAARREGWRALRGSLHQALALRGSRVALYDLRETLADAAGPLPASYLAAVHVLGDDSCLEPLAAAFSRADPRASWWRHQLASAFRAVARRERITKRHAVMKRIQNRWPDVASELAAQ